MRIESGRLLLLCGACLVAGSTFVVSAAQAAGGVSVAISDDAVSISAQGASLRSVLEEISWRSGLTVRSQAALDQAVSLRIEAATLGEAIRRLLANRSYMLFEPKAGDTGPRQTYEAANVLWILADEGHGGESEWTARSSYIEKVAPDHEIVDFRLLAASQRASDRQEAMFAIADLGHSGEIGHLQQGLSDPDDEVRAAAIMALGDLGGPEAVRLLGLALNDPSASLRMDAVDALGDIGGEQVVELLRQSLPRQPASVREAAAIRLTELAWEPQLR